MKTNEFIQSRLSNGGEYLFQTKDDEEMNGWVSKLQACAAAAESASAAAAAASSRAQTMPVPASKEEPKKRGFFTLSKKK